MEVNVNYPADNCTILTLLHWLHCSPQVLKETLLKESMFKKYIQNNMSSRFIVNIWNGLTVTRHGGPIPGGGAGRINQGACRQKSTVYIVDMNGNVITMQFIFSTLPLVVAIF